MGSTCKWAATHNNPFITFTPVMSIRKQATLLNHALLENGMKQAICPPTGQNYKSKSWQNQDAHVLTTCIRDI
jgi:hypothetical protein